MSHQKKELSHGDLARDGKRTCTSRGSNIVFGLTDDLTDLTETHFLRKKSEAFSWLQKYTAKQKAKGSLVQKFKSDKKRKFDSAACKKYMKTESIQ